MSWTFSSGKRWDSSRVVFICSHLAVATVRTLWRQGLLMTVRAGCGDNHSYRQISCCSECITMSFGCDGDLLQILLKTKNEVINMAAVCPPPWGCCRCSHLVYIEQCLTRADTVEMEVLHCGVYDVENTCCVSMTGTLSSFKIALFLRVHIQFYFLRYLAGFPQHLGEFAAVVLLDLVCLCVFCLFPDWLYMMLRSGLCSGQSICCRGALFFSSLRTIFHKWNRLYVWACCHAAEKIWGRSDASLM